MGLIFFLGIPLLPPRAKIRAWGLGGLEKQFRMKDMACLLVAAAASAGWFVLA